ncbi:MAG TPA: hypothetical protein VFU21_32025, partial [Kofleriaceae bacterium]|nr:hypothetical protein [Kofleriaceae bacterium]
TELRAWEDAARRATDFENKPAADRSLGPNPYRLARLSDGRAVGILRGADALVLLDPRGREEARVATPPSPTALLVDRDGVIWVGGTGSPEVALYRIAPGLTEVGRFRLDGWTVRALAEGGPGWVYAADERTGAVTALSIDRAKKDAAPQVAARRELARCRAPIELARADHHLVVNCLYDHTLLAYPIDAAGAPDGGPPIRMAQDGPLWSLTAHGDLVAAGGVEDHPLERKGGGFGYIDSFLFVYRLPDAARLVTINLSASGIVTPKWVRLEGKAGAMRVTTAGYATGLLAEVVLREGRDAEIKTRPFAPGTTDYLAGEGQAPALAASPLLDAWLVGDPPEQIDVPGAAPRPLESRIGEALVFTTLMAPWSSSDGKKSRFTCETCHFEAQGDGRIHYTGRGEVHAATKPLRGLWNNRPHFTRAMDRTTTDMVHAEFRVANRWNGRDPWFEVGVADVPWLQAIRGAPARLGPVELRRSFMVFLADLTYETNPAVRGRDRFDERERAGAALFRDRCERCHRARLVAEDPASAIPFERWEELVLSPNGPIVWASAEYQKTGVLPYVHELGARTTGLRRIAHKQPHFTNGSARTLADVLDRVRFAGDRFLHDAAGENGVTSLTQPERDALLAFLELL